MFQTDLRDIFLKNIHGIDFLLTRQAFAYGYERLDLNESNINHFLFDLNSFSRKKLDTAFPAESSSVSFQSSTERIKTYLRTGQLKIFHVDFEAEQRKRQREATYTEIRSHLNEIIAAERAEAAQLEQIHKQRSKLEKTAAHASHAGKGLLAAGESFLSWTKEIYDVVAIHKQVERIGKAAITTVRTSAFEEWGTTFYSTWREAEYRELIEALGFDPSRINPEIFARAWDMAVFLWEDEPSQAIITQFAKDYARAQHSLEVAELAGSAAFEVLLTIVLIAATGGTGAVANLASKPRLVGRFQKVGKLFERVVHLKPGKKKPGRPQAKQIRKGTNSSLSEHEVEGSISQLNTPPKGKGKAKPIESPDTERESVTRKRHRAGNKQVFVDGQLWNVPEGSDITDIPNPDTVGDALQGLTEEAAARWDDSQLSLNEQLAIAEAEEAHEYWRANLLKAQAKGRWVENEVRDAVNLREDLNIDWSRVGVDATDTESGAKYDILSGTASNIDRHAKRMPDELFRMITF